MRVPALFLVTLALACSFEPDPVEEETVTPVPGDQEGTPADDGSEPSGPSTPSDPEPCVPLGCAELGAECGMQDDGCGAQVACGGCPGSCEDARCVCGADRMEPNPSASDANDLGEASDEWGAEWPLADLAVRDAADEDWFRVHVVDEIGFQNPWIVVELEQDADVHQVDVFFTCDNGGDASACLLGLEQDESGFGTACRGVGDSPVATLAAQCEDTLDESGTVWVRVRRDRWDASCPSYSLNVAVNR